MDLQQHFYSESSSDEDFPLENEETEVSPSKSKDSQDENIFFKLLNRERSGYLSTSLMGRSNQPAFNKVPSRLRFCLKDIVPYCYLRGHIFMGLTICGQYLLSYKVCYDEGSLSTDYNFSTYYKYTLYFWIYRPHLPLGKYFKVCLFDDHGVDNLKLVTMTQWMHNSSLLVIHGGSECENEDSYLTIARVPKLGCLDCKKLRDIDSDGYALCIKCNLTIHTKYSTTESDPRFNPFITLTCPEKIVFLANGFIHMLHVDLEIQKQQPPSSSPQHHHSQQATAFSNLGITPISYMGRSVGGAASGSGYSGVTTLQQQQPQCSGMTFDSSNLPKPDKTASDFSQDGSEKKSPSSSTEIGCDNKNNIVARILADFSEFDIESPLSPGEKGGNRLACADANRNKNYNELIFTCGSSTASSSSTSRNSLSYTASNTGNAATKGSLVSHHQGKRNHRIVTKSYRNGMATDGLQTSASRGEACNNIDKASAYEFSEDNEKCEKIGTFRKRRLADKKYEFSEDNSENIIPFTKARLSIQAQISRLHRSPHTSSHHHSPHSAAIYLSGSSSQSYETTSHLHRASPSQGFRSPCGSPVGNNSRYMRSPTSRAANQSTSIFHQKSPPPSMSPSYYQQQPTVTKPPNTLSPRQVYTAKRAYYDVGNVSPTSPFLSPRRDDFGVCGRAGENSPLPHADGSEKPSCTKKFKRRFVEEDDAASVITSEEDDCISPGYHTFLPVEVHGSCYSVMQMISQTSYQKLKCPTVIITQHSFDLETFTYHVISNLCQTNNKSYDVFYDWACEVINVCPTSGFITCILMAHFTARDQLPTNIKQCINCSRNIDCVFHRKQFECRILFRWNMDTGDWDVVDYGELLEVPSSSAIGKSNRCSLTKVARQLAVELATSLDRTHSFAHSLRVLDSNMDKSKASLVDEHNLIEFYRGNGFLMRY